jgi:hypothetical protein
MDTTNTTVPNQTPVSPAVTATPVVEAPKPTPPVITPPPAPVVPHVVPPAVVIETPVVKVDDVAAFIAGIKAKGTLHEQSLVTSLDNYVSKMSPRIPNTSEAGVKHQYSLWKAIQSVAETAPKEQFNSLWNIILTYFRLHKDGVFGDRYLYRFIEQWQWDEKDLEAMKNIFNLLQLTADPVERKKNLSLVSLEKTLSVGIYDEARDRITLFYKNVG